MKSFSKGKGRVLSDDESNEDFQTQGFEVRDSDAEQLWDVVAIRGERKGMYLIQWAGADEKGRPWDDSWVPREDVTDDLVEAWNEEKAAKEKAAKKKANARKSAGRRERKRQESSTSASRSRTDSKRSTNTTSSGKRGHSRRASSTTTLERDDNAPVSTIRSSPGKKRKQIVLSDVEEGSSTADDDAPRKKRKVGPGYDSRRSSSRKKSKRRSSDSEDEGVEEVSREHDEERRANIPKPLPRREEEEELEDDHSTSNKHATRQDQRATPSHKPRPKSRKASRHGEGESEEEGDDGGDLIEISSTIRAASKKLGVPTPKPKSADEQIASATTSPEASRILDRRPTPPRRTLAKSSRNRAEIHEPMASSRKKLNNGTKRKGPPGVRVSAVDRQSDASDLSSSEEGKLSKISGIRSSHASDTKKKKDGLRNRSHSPSSVLVPIVLIPTPKRQGFTARMKGKEKIKSDESGPRTDPGVASIEQEFPDVASSVHTLKDHPDVIDVIVDNADDDGGLMYDFDMADDPLPFSQNDEPLSAQTDPTRNVASVQEMNENDVVEPSASKGTIIPPSQSQSQSQSQSRPDTQDITPDDLQLASVIAEHGSAAFDVNESIEVDLQAHPAQMVHASEAGMPPATVSSSVTDPEPTADSNKNAKLIKIPVVTPSKFRPYLPQPQKPLSMLPPPHNGMQGIANNDEPISSIESPLKEFDVEEETAGQKLYKNSVEPLPTTDSTATVDDDDIEDDTSGNYELRRRGLELAEMQRKREREELRQPVRRIHLDKLLEGAARVSSLRSLIETSKPTSIDVEGRHFLPGVPEERTLNPEDEDEDEETRVRRFEEEYLNFDGNAGVTSPLPDRIRSASVDDEPRNDLADQRDEPSHAPKAEAYEEADVDSALRHAHDEDDPFLSHGNVEDREGTPTTTTSQQDDMEFHTPVKNRFRILGSPNKLESPLVQTPSRQLNEAMGLLHAKSEEIELLKRQLAESEGKRLSQDNAYAELQAENSVLRKTQEEQQASIAEPDNAMIEQHKEKCDSLMKDVDARDAEINLLKMSRDDAVKQSEIFRELYGTASSFADEMKQENVDLLARAKLAEGQVNIGLELIRKQHSVQEQKLKADLERQKILVHVLSTKDQRTDDEVRRRAALEPELRAEIDTLKEEILELKASQSNVIHQRDELLVEKHQLRDEFEQIRARYNDMTDERTWLQIQVARLTAREKAFKKVFLTTSAHSLDSEADRSEERVYVCKWMKNYDGKTRCNSLFSNVQDLTDHLFVDHQL